MGNERNVRKCEYKENRPKPFYPDSRQTMKVMPSNF